MTDDQQAQQSPYLDEREVAARYGVPVSTLQYWRYNARGPAWFKIGKLVRYRADEVEAWVAAQRRNPEGV